jgi:murein DD-endopeptidase MepM/ murein hydrolase activator NlpD
MQRPDRYFPVGLRVLVATCALLLLTWLVPSSATAGNTSKGQVDAAKKAYDAALAKLSSIRAQVQGIQTQLNAAADKVDQQQQLVDKVTADLMQTRQQIADAEARYEKIRTRLNARAVESFMDGPGSNLGFILGATSLVDLSDRMEFVNAVTDSDANLAQQVDNIRAELQADEVRLQNLQAQRKQQLDQLLSIRDQIAASLRQVSDLQVLAAHTVESTLHNYKNLKSSYAKFLQQQAQAAVVGGSHAPVPLPARYKDILKTCPVGSPRAFGDGFGAPRYTGGFHLHAGVDVMAAGGTPIYAPFDGVAHTSYNTLGGNAVYVEGSQGYVYNAHLSQYSDKSNGPVHTGDVIGYVGETGDAVGTHDHFEFHPYFSVPSDWPVSFYGYQEIGTALNPYPLLVAACG